MEKNYQLYQCLFPSWNFIFLDDLFLFEGQFVKKIIRVDRLTQLKIIIISFDLKREFQFIGFLPWRLLISFWNCLRTIFYFIWMITNIIIKTVRFIDLMLLLFKFAIVIQTVHLISLYLDFIITFSAYFFIFFLVLISIIVIRKAVIVLKIIHCPLFLRYLHFLYYHFVESIKCCQVILKINCRFFREKRVEKMRDYLIKVVLKMKLAVFVFK